MNDKYNPAVVVGYIVLCAAISALVSVITFVLAWGTQVMR